MAGRGSGSWRTDSYPGAQPDSNDVYFGCYQQNYSETLTYLSDNLNMTEAEFRRIIENQLLRTRLTKQSLLISLLNKSKFGLAISLWQMKKRPRKFWKGYRQARILQHWRQNIQRWFCSVGR
jgi:hypothetical protein